MLDIANNLDGPGATVTIKPPVEASKSIQTRNERLTYQPLGSKIIKKRNLSKRNSGKIGCKYRYDNEGIKRA